jgi:hypothetical protein
MATAFDLTDLTQLTEFARTEVPLPATFGLNQFLPDVTIDDIRVDVGTITRTNRSAIYKAYDAATPIGVRDTFTTSTVKIPPVGQKLPIGEYEAIQLNAARGAQTSQLVDAIYDDVANSVRAIQIRAEYARADVLTDGKLTLTGENNLTIEYDGGVAAGNLDDTVGVDWATVATSDPVNDLMTIVAAYSAQSSDGSEPDWIIMSKQVFGYIQRSTKTLALFNSQVTGAPGVLTNDAVNSVFSAYNLPPVYLYDAKAVSPAGASGRILAADKIILGGNGLGRTIWGVTAEALELQASGFLVSQPAAGITAVVSREYDPVRVWTKAVATMMPVIDDPTKLYVVDVTAS